MKKYIISLLAVISALAAEPETKKAEKCLITMGYKPYAKEPYIFKDGSGIYRDVYSEALKRIGCRLKIVRLPKRRIIQKLKKGTIDFYPVFGYTEERAAYTYFIPNWMPHQGILVTRKDIPPLHSLKELVLYKPILLKEIGGWSPMEAIPGKRFETTDVNVAKAFKLLLNKRIDAFHMQEVVVRHYLKNHPEIKGVRLHPDLFPPVKTKMLGFSRLSPHFQEKVNPYYDPRKPISLQNPLTVIDENSTAYRFSKALDELHENGEIQKIIEHYTKP